MFVDIIYFARGYLLIYRLLVDILSYVNCFIINSDLEHSRETAEKEKGQ
jgi:hypothetical protein